MKKTNPNGANQYALDPRQKKCWEFYVSPKSKTFGNAYRSAIKAGYEEDTAKQITVANWFLEKTRRLNLLSKAEKVLDETLGMVVVDDKGKIDNGLSKTRLDAAKFVASTQGKTEGYTTRVETDLTTKGEKIEMTMTQKEAREVREKYEKELRDKLAK